MTELKQGCQCFSFLFCGLFVKNSIVQRGSGCGSASTVLTSLKLVISAQEIYESILFYGKCSSKLTNLTIVGVVNTRNDVVISRSMRVKCTSASCRCLSSEVVDVIACVCIRAIIFLSSPSPNSVLILPFPLVAGSFKSQLTDYFRGAITSWELVEGSLWQFYDNET